MSFDDSISMVEEAEPGSPRWARSLPRRWSFPRRKSWTCRLRLRSTTGPSLPSLQTLYPRKRVGRVVGTVLAGLLLGLVGLASVDAGGAPIAFRCRQPSSPLAHASSASTASPVPVGKVTGEPVVAPSASASQQATAAPPVPTDSAQPRPWEAFAAGLPPGRDGPLLP